MDNRPTPTHSCHMGNPQTSPAEPTAHRAAASDARTHLGAALAGEFSAGGGYLNTASQGLLPARSARVLGTVVTEMSSGDLDMVRCFERIDDARASFASLVGVAPERVAAGTSVAVHVGLVAASLPPGAQVLTARGDFASVVTPFAVREDLVVRSVPLEELAEAITDETDLVAVSAVQSADGRIADLAALAEAARAHDALTLVDATQAAGWLPLDLGRFDYAVCGAYKWLLCPRGTSFLVVSHDRGPLRPLHGGWVAAELPWDMCYGPVPRFAAGARRFEEPVPFLPYLAAAESLRLMAEVGVTAVGAHNRALADRFRAGAADLGLPAVPGDSAIVSLPGVGEEGAKRAAAAGVRVSVRAGDLRAAFHLYNTEAEVDLLLEALAGTGSAG